MAGEGFKYAAAEQFENLRRVLDMGTQRFHIIRPHSMAFQHNCLLRILVHRRSSRRETPISMVYPRLSPSMFTRTTPLLLAARLQRAQDFYSLGQLAHSSERNEEAGPVLVILGHVEGY